MNGTIFRSIAVLFDYKLAGTVLGWSSSIAAYGAFVIPALFGAFGNFLLPTQLGVRDVAFPRLNSFMFWFTPGGLLLRGQF